MEPLKPSRCPDFTQAHRDRHRGKTYRGVGGWSLECSKSGGGEGLVSGLDRTPVSHWEYGQVIVLELRGCICIVLVSNRSAAFVFRPPISSIPSLAPIYCWCSSSLFLSFNRCNCCGRRLSHRQRNGMPQP